MASEKNLNAVFTDIANSIRSKKGTTGTIQPINMADEISTIETGSNDTRFKEIVEGTMTSVDDSTITTVNDYAFAYIRSLTSVNLPNATYLGPNAFWYCEALENINLNNVIIVERSALSHTGATVISLPKATTIYGSAISGNSNLITVSIPSVTKFIDNYSFAHCPNLVSVDMNFPMVGGYDFYNCSSLKSAKIKLNSNNYVSGVFNNCSSLERVEIDDGYMIGSYFFEKCSLLKQLIIRKKTKRVALQNSTIFENTPIATSTTEGFIYVPDDLVESYKTATNWSTYASKIKGISELGE